MAVIEHPPRLAYTEDQARDDHGRFGEGGGGGRLDVGKLIADNPQKPGEASFEWQARLVSGIKDDQTKSDVLFQTRERYEPVGYIKDGAARWCEEHGLPAPPAGIVETPVNLKEGEAIAQFFDQAHDASGNPDVQAAYADFKNQSEAMFEYMTRSESEGGLGIKVDFVNQKDPYDSAKAQADDLRDNHHINLESGLGGHHEASMTREEYDRFRAVHDVFGHAGVGGGFDRHGEYEAWLMHSSMYTDPGRQAMSAEYHGVNSALWGSTNQGDNMYPGTGKTVLLPEGLGTPPWERPATAAALPTYKPNAASTEIVAKLGLDDMFAWRYDNPPWHPFPEAVATEMDATTTAPKLGYSEDQPRADNGRFGEGGGAGGKGTAEREAADRSNQEALLGGHAGTKDDPVPCGKDLDRAQACLANGLHITLDQPRQVATLLTKLNQTVKQLEQTHGKAPNFDLCKVSVPGTNLFCNENKGIPRAQMPQISGQPIPGSKADELPKKGDPPEVDATAAFIDYLHGQGIGVKEETQPAENLRASQSELVGAKVAGMVASARAGNFEPNAKPIFVTRDGYILDGHHRWAATIGLELGDASSLSIPTHTIDMDIGTAITMANQFANDFGIKQKSGTAPAQGAAAAASEDCGCSKCAEEKFVKLALATVPLKDVYPTPDYPPWSWFTVAGAKQAGMQPGDRLSVTEDGQVFGYWYQKGVCLIDGTNECWQPDPSPSGYQLFHQGSVVTDDGVEHKLEVGVIGNVGGHASPFVSGSVAMRHYADPDAQIFIGRAYDDEHGGVFCGAVVPGRTYGDVALARRAALSGDWRYFRNGDEIGRVAAVTDGYDCLGPTLVNRPGLPIVRVFDFTSSRAASAGVDVADFHPVFLGGMGGVHIATADDEREAKLAFSPYAPRSKDGTFKHGRGGTAPKGDRLAKLQDMLEAVASWARKAPTDGRDLTSLNIAHRMLAQAIEDSRADRIDDVALHLEAADMHLTMADRGSFHHDLSTMIGGAMGTEPVAAAVESPEMAAAVMRNHGAAMKATAHEYNMPGWDGHSQSLSETFARAGDHMTGAASAYEQGDTAATVDHLDNAGKLVELAAGHPNVRPEDVVQHRAAVREAKQYTGGSVAAAATEGFVMGINDSTGAVLDSVVEVVDPVARAAAIHDAGGGPISIDYMAVHAPDSTVMQAAPDSSTKEPYGKVEYADTGFQKDGKKRYPLDTEAHVRSAWSYINQSDNASQYEAGDLAKVKAAIQRAGKKLGIKYGEPAAKAADATGSGRIVLELPDGTRMEIDEATDVIARGDVVAVHTAASGKGGMSANDVANDGDTKDTPAEADSERSMEDRMTAVEETLAKLCDMMSVQAAAAQAEQDAKAKAKRDEALAALDEFSPAHHASVLEALDIEPVLVGRN